MWALVIDNMSLNLGYVGVALWEYVGEEVLVSMVDFIVGYRVVRVCGNDLCVERPVDWCILFEQI